MPANTFEQTEGTPVKIVTGDNMRATLQRIENRGHGGTPGSKSPASLAAFQIGDTTLVGTARWIDRAGIIVTFVLPGTLLDVSRSRIDRRHDRACGWVGGLAGMDNAGIQIVSSFHFTDKTFPVVRLRT